MTPKLPRGLRARKDGRSAAGAARVRGGIVVETDEAVDGGGFDGTARGVDA